MTQVKRNSREFKIIRDIFDLYKENSARMRSIKLYFIRPYESLDNKVLLNDSKKAKKVVYDLAFETILDYLHFNYSKKLFREQDGLYYFKTSAKSKWVEYPFSLSASLQKKVPVLKVVTP